VARLPDSEVLDHGSGKRLGDVFAEGTGLMGYATNFEQYKRRLLELEKQLSDRLLHEEQSGREHTFDVPADSGDASLADEANSEEFTRAELDATILKQVRDALRRIDEGTFGRCAVDGGPIEEMRLQTVPWTPYCFKHQKLLEAASRQRAPTL
jgi:DnaK suppressor protein